MNSLVRRNQKETKINNNNYQQTEKSEHCRCKGAEDHQEEKCTCRESDKMPLFLIAGVAIFLFLFE